MQTPTPLDEEYLFDDGLILSSTDLKGIITYANRKFCDISGYTKDELRGKNHNIVRHPDMPKATYKNLWETLHAGKAWTGTIKNLRKDGKYYWVYSYVTPIMDQGNIIGYSAARRPASKTEITETIQTFNH
jgi:aerotaxis receptor